jgi:hypothetical protein
VDPATLDDALRSGDVDELLRLVDACCTSRDWPALASLRLRCDRAHETGHQLWPVSSHAAYRLALEAPASFAAEVLVEGTGRFAAGPLAEVAAQHHTWAELAPEVSRTAPAMLAAHERVVRGEDLSHVTLPGPQVLELPLHLASWEPTYALAEYHEHGADFPAPPVSPTNAVELPRAPSVEPLDDAAVALRDVVRVWADGSNGHVEVVSVRGDVTHAIAALGPAAARVAAVSPGDAFAHLAWAGASGGAFGRRPGAAAGRFAAWWAGAACGGVLDDWPPDPERLGARLAELRWVLWDAAEPGTGWRLQIAVADPARELAWAINALDSR